MKIQLTLEVPDDRFTQCISEAWEKAYDEPLPTIQIVPFTVRAIVTPTDVKNMLGGSCLGELLNGNEFEMKVVE